MKLTDKIYKEMNNTTYYRHDPGKGWGSDVEGVLSNEDMDDLINLLQKYKGGGI